MRTPGQGVSPGADQEAPETTSTTEVQDNRHLFQSFGDAYGTAEVK